MSKSSLPERASLEYLRKLAKERLRELRDRTPDAKLSDAQLAIAREHGFPSWRALKADIDRRAGSPLDQFLDAARSDDADAMRRILASHPTLARERHKGTSALHMGVTSPAAVRLLLDRGADAHARDEGDNATPLFFAAWRAPIEVVRMLLDAGADPRDETDLHLIGPVGAATIWDAPRHDVVELLLERGASHHVFSAIAMGDRGALRDLVRRDPRALARTLSTFESGQTAVHYCIAPPDGLVGGRFRTGDHYRTLELLTQLGADLEAVDGKGRTPMELAMLRGDRDAMRILRSAGAPVPRTASLGAIDAAAVAKSVRQLGPMLAVRDMAESLGWYRALGFEVVATNGEGRDIDWAELRLGDTSLMLVPSGGQWRDQAAGISLWFRTDRLDDFHALCKQRQMEHAVAVMEGRPAPPPPVKFRTDLHTAFYGQREFSIEDPSGYDLNFCQTA